MTKRLLSALRLSILSVALVLLVGCADEGNPVALSETEGAVLASNGIAGAGAATSVEREVILLDLTLPFGPGVVPCAGERLNIAGPVAVRIHTTIDGRGRIHQVGYYDWKDVVATGLTSGDTWHTTAGLELYTTLNYELTEPFQPVPTPVQTGDPAVFHHTGAIRFLSDADGTDLYVRHVVQTVVGPDGDVSVDKTFFELLECR